MSEQDKRSLDRQMSRVEALVSSLEKLSNPAARVVAQELVQTLLALHGSGLERMLELLRQSENGAALLETWGEDSLVGNLLMLHGLHPVTVETRARQALRCNRCCAVTAASWNWSRLSIRLCGFECAANVPCPRRNLNTRLRRHSPRSRPMCASLRSRRLPRAAWRCLYCRTGKCSGSRETSAIGLSPRTLRDPSPPAAFFPSRGCSRRPTVLDQVPPAATRLVRILEKSIFPACNWDDPRMSSSGEKMVS